MDLIRGIRKWLDSIVANFNCGLNGHGNVVVLQTYEPVVRVKNWRGNSLKNLVLTEMREEKVFKQKCACRTCGEVFLRTYAEPVWPRCQ